jgi:hypothetical protein
MFGTTSAIPGSKPAAAAFDALMEEWSQTIRPKIPDEFVQLAGRVDGQPDDLVFVDLAQDKATYQQLAQLPEQDAWCRRMAELIEGDVRWEDVAK